MSFLSLSRQTMRTQPRRLTGSRFAHQNGFCLNLNAGRKPAVTCSIQVCVICFRSRTRSVSNSLTKTKGVSMGQSTLYRSVLCLA